MENQENQKNNNVDKEEVILNTSNEHTTSNVVIDDTIKNVHDKREKNKKLQILLISIVCLIIVLIASFLIIRHYRGLKEYTYNEEYPLYQYFAGAKNVYKGKVTISLDDEITKLESDTGVVDIEDAPIYFQDVENEALISRNMLLVIPRIPEKNNKIKLFSKIVYEDDSKSAFYYLGNKKIFLDESFLYDGNNLYMFLSNVVVIIDEKKYELSPLSYMIVNYQDQIEIYDKKLDTYEIIETHKNDVVATLGNHKINLSTDMVNDNRILMKNIDNLPVYENKWFYHFFFGS